MGDTGPKTSPKENNDKPDKPKDSKPNGNDEKADKTKKQDSRPKGKDETTSDEAKTPDSKPKDEKNEKARSPNESKSDNPSFTCAELVDLALCHPEVGAVNFNILRMLIKDMIDKTGMGKAKVKLNDVESHQIQNFKNYVQGSNVASPMPGVLRIAQKGPARTAGRQPVLTTSGGPVTPRSGKPTQSQAIGFGTVNFVDEASYVDAPPVVIDDDMILDMYDKVMRTDRELRLLRELPTNVEILAGAKGGVGKSISVQEMWQIIQLNNRIAATEAAIQKMASLIEDLARNMGKVKADAKLLKQDASELAKTGSDLMIQGQGMSDKYGPLSEIVATLQQELTDLKLGWKQDRENIQKILGVDLGKVPSFMRPRRPPGPLGPRPRPPGAPGQGPPPGQEPSGVTEASSSQIEQPAERATQTIVKKGPRMRKPAPDKAISARQITQMTPEEMLRTLSPEDLELITPEHYKELTVHQKKALNFVRRSVKQASDAPKVAIGLAKMSPEELAEVPAQAILDRMPYEEAVSLPPEVFDMLNDDQKEMVRKVVDRGPPRKATSRRDLASKGKSKAETKKPRPSMGVISMTQDQLKKVDSQEIKQKMTYEEARAIPANVFEKMRKSQQDAIQQILDAGPPPGFKEKPLGKRKSVVGLASMSLTELRSVSVAQISEMPYEEAKNLPPEVYEKLSDQQKEALQKVIEKGPSETSLDDEYDEPRRLTGEEVGVLADIPAEDLAAMLTPEQAAAIPEEELMDKMTPEQIQEIEKIKRKTAVEVLDGMTEEYVAGLTEEEETEEDDGVRLAKKSEVEEHDETDHDHLDDEEEAAEQERNKTRRKSMKRVDRKQKQRRMRRRKSGDVEVTEPVEIVTGGAKAVGEEKPPMSLEQYLETLTPEEAANIAADAVQKELEKQYKHLQGMQRQLAQDIQEKMEFIYQKLLAEIATQQITTSPYGAIGGLDNCMGPGICEGHAMPAGVAVCQIGDEADKERQKSLAGEVPEERICPGPGVCPGRDICPYCIADARAREALQDLKGPDVPGPDISSSESKGKTVATAVGTEQGDAIFEEMRTLMILDMEKIREEMKLKTLAAYDEQDIVERLGAVWEALKILKNNEEALAIRIAKQDAFIKKFPPKTVEKLQKIPEENLDALITGNMGRGLLSDDRRATLAGVSYDMGQTRRTFASMGGGGGGGGGANSEDVQTLFDNLAHVIGECTELKERLDQLTDTARILESGMVSKTMLYDALGDKADRGLISTKVSYDEFGNTVDELNIQLHNLMTEGYQRNENWKKVTADLAEELSEKLDKAELAPIRAFFKNRWRLLEEKVKNLSRLLDEPDPAGTRRKLLKDYNCLSCDRSVNISGLTNVSKLPTIGAIPARPQTASKRALEINKMRFRNGKQVEESRRSFKSDDRVDNSREKKSIPNLVNPQDIADDMDVMHIVNRYTGGSHTTITTADVKAAQKRPSTVINGQDLAAAVNGSSEERKRSNAGSRASASKSAENLAPRVLNLR